jgi:Cu+-exporting ATPase
VIGIAAGAAVFWSASGNLARALLVFTAVLIVACPCALALAAPFTLGSAQRLLARRGVFLRNGAVLERMAAVDTVVFDKTGTLTAADSAAASFEGGALTAEEERWVASLARQSTHPHSARVHQLLTGRGSPEPVESFLEMPGLGLEGSVRGHAVVLGSAAWLELRGARVETGTAPPAGGSVHVAIDGRRRGAFVLGGCLCPEAEAMLRRLARGCSIELLSGDNARQIEAFRHLFGDPSRLNFNQSPTDKLGYVRSLQGRGKTVMMVGDGLNDAGALKQGDVGVAVVERAGVFSPASDVILEAGQVPRLAALVAVARGASRAVKMSLGLSAVYNIVGISIAAAGGFSPLVCAILMPLSSISVVLFACAASGRVVRREWPDTAGAAGAARLGAAAAAGGALEPAEAAA